MASLVETLAEACAKTVWRVQAEHPKTDRRKARIARRLRRETTTCLPQAGDACLGGTSVTNGEREHVVPNPLGQVPLEVLDLVVDPKRQKRIPNPEKGGVQMTEEY